MGEGACKDVYRMERFDTEQWVVIDDREDAGALQCR